MRTRQLLGVATAALLLAGCSGVSGFPVFDREPTAQDRLPSDFDTFDAETLEEFDHESARYAGSFDDVEAYLILNSEGLPCLALADGTSSSIACGGTGSVVTGSQHGPTFELAPAPIAEGEGWTVLSENVRARP